MLRTPLTRHCRGWHWGRCLWLALVSLGCTSEPAPLRPALAALEQGTPEQVTLLTRDALPQARRTHLAHLGADDWHQQGHCGKGIKVALLDSGFRGYRAFLGTGLPGRVQIRSFRKD